ncbi:TPA: hypothetical protein RTG57_001775 [Campylobacter jejuni]|nr:hypothetical protein [Campylobacter jejuni]
MNKFTSKIDKTSDKIDSSSKPILEKRLALLNSSFTKISNNLKSNKTIDAKSLSEVENLANQIDKLLIKLMTAVNS